MLISARDARRYQALGPLSGVLLGASEALARYGETSIHLGSNSSVDNIGALMTLAYELGYGVTLVIEKPKTPKLTSQGNVMFPEDYKRIEEVLGAKNNMARFDVEVKEDDAGSCPSMWLKIYLHG